MKISHEILINITFILTIINIVISLFLFSMFFLIIDNKKNITDDQIYTEIGKTTYIKANTEEFKVGDVVYLDMGITGNFKVKSIKDIETTDKIIGIVINKNEVMLSSNR